MKLAPGFPLSAETLAGALGPGWNVTAFPRKPGLFRARQGTGLTRVDAIIALPPVRQTAALSAKRAWHELLVIAVFFVCLTATRPQYGYPIALTAGAIASALLWLGLRPSRRRLERSLADKINGPDLRG